MAKYISINANGLREEIQPINVSTGVSDAEKIIETGADGKIDASFMPTGFGDEILTKTADEVIAAGAYVHVLPSGNIVNADASNNREAHGFVKDSVIAAASVSVYFDGNNDALSGLTIGSEYFLGLSGDITLTPTTVSGQTHQLIGTAITATAMTTSGMGTNNVVIRA